MRKSVLLAGSALAVAGLTVGAQKAEAAEISLGMYMPFIIGGADHDNDAYSQIGFGTTDTEFYVTGSETLENGIKVAVKFQFDAGDGESNNTDETEIEVSGSFGLLSLGREDGPADLMNLGATKVKAWAFGSFANTTGVPVNFTANSGAATGNEAGLDTSDDTKIAYYTPRWSGFQVGASWAKDNEIIACTGGNCGSGGSGTPNNDDAWEVGANYMNTFGDFDIGVAASYFDGADDADRWSIGALVGYAGFTASGQYSDGSRNSSTDVSTWDIGVGYSTGPWSAHLVYEYGDADYSGGTSGEASMIHAGAAYALGPGVSVGASVGFGNDQIDGGADDDYTVFTTGIVVSF
jgi:outer membrane protein OmpU